MLVRPGIEDWKLVCRYTGQVLIGIACLIVLPALTAVAFREWASLVDFLVGLGAALALGSAMALAGATDRRPTWMHGMATAGISWLVATASPPSPIGSPGTTSSISTRCST